MICGYGWSKNTFFLKRAYSLRAQFHGNFFAVKHESFGLEVWFPDFFGMALRKTDVTAVLLALAGEITFLHRVLLYLLSICKSRIRSCYT